MIKIIRFLKMLFGKYEIGHEYFVNVKDINIPEHIKKYKIKPCKWNHKLKYWLEIGEFESFILLHRDFTLIDGYSSYLIAKKIQFRCCACIFCRLMIYTKGMKIWKTI